MSLAQNLNPIAVREEKYIPTNDEGVAKEYLEYLKDLSKEHESRLIAIENKNAQLMGQASLVISIVALFIPLFINGLKGLPLLFVFILIVLFIAVISMYSSAIFNASKTLQINKYQYTAGSTMAVTKDDRADNVLGFLNAQNEILIYSINKNTKILNEKAGNLIVAGKFYRLGNIIFLFFILSIIYSSFQTNEKFQKVFITNFDSSTNKKMDSIIYLLQHKNDTTFSKNGSR